MLRGHNTELPVLFTSPFPNWYLWEKYCDVVVGVYVEPDDAINWQGVFFSIHNDSYHVCDTALQPGYLTLLLEDSAMLPKHPVSWESLRICFHGPEMPSYLRMLSKWRHMPRPSKHMPHNVTIRKMLGVQGRLSTSRLRRSRRSYPKLRHKLSSVIRSEKWYCRQSLRCCKYTCRYVRCATIM